MPVSNNDDTILLFKVCIFHDYKDNILPTIHTYNSLFFSVFLQENGSSCTFFQKKAF